MEVSSRNRVHFVTIFLNKMFGCLQNDLMLQQSVSSAYTFFFCFKCGRGWGREEEGIFYHSSLLHQRQILLNHQSAWFWCEFHPAWTRPELDHAEPPTQEINFSWSCGQWLTRLWCRCRPCSKTTLFPLELTTTELSTRRLHEEWRRMRGSRVHHPSAR